MDRFRELLACPSCGGMLSAAWSCCVCAARFDFADGVPNLRLPAEGPTETVRRFYERAPFPGYPPREDLQMLHARAERHPFVRLIDRAIPGDARIVDVGCGTGQMCLYLARADRVVVGADLTRVSLVLGAAAAARFGLDRVQFVETDLQRPGLRRGAFDVVYSSGVVHHTSDPRASFARIAELARPGGFAARRLQRDRASRRGFDGLPRGSRATGSSRSIGASRSGGTQRVVAPGCAISTGILKNTDRRSPKCSAGLLTIAWSICATIRVLSLATHRRICSRPPPTTGVSNAG
jgi:SAM-dependent methyltransferase